MGVGVISGTSLQGSMPDSTTYQALVDVFGDPNLDVTQDRKTDAEWFGTIGGDMFAIYNYKTGFSYLGPDGIPVRNITGNNWHIGGFYNGVFRKVVTYFNNKLKHIRSNEKCHTTLKQKSESEL